MNPPKFDRLAWAVHSFVYYVISVIINACNGIHLICNSLQFVQEMLAKKNSETSTKFILEFQP